MEQLLAWIGAFVTSFILGALKRYTNIADTWVWAKIKSFQPILVYAVGYLLPLAWAAIHATGVMPDPTALVGAPAATAVAMVCAEIVNWLTKKFAPKPPNPLPA